MKTILFYLLVSCLFVSCQEKNQPEKEQDCIKSALAIDDSIGKIRNHECERISLSRTISNYTTGMKAIDMKDCPNSFSNAYDLHRKAWDEVLPITNKYPELRGEMHDLFKQIEAGKDSVLFKKRVAAVWATWAEVEKASERKE